MLRQAVSTEASGAAGVNGLASRPAETKNPASRRRAVFVLKSYLRSLRTFSTRKLTTSIIFSAPPPMVALVTYWPPTTMVGTLVSW